LNQFSCQFSQLGSSFCGSEFNNDILAFNVAKLVALCPMRFAFFI
jgi:hypothetical protein